MSVSVQYLTGCLKNTLPLCLQDLCESRPEDPIDYIARWLYKSVDCEMYYYDKILFTQEIEMMILEYEMETERKIDAIKEIAHRIKLLKIAIKQNAKQQALLFAEKKPKGIQFPGAQLDKYYREKKQSAWIGALKYTDTGPKGKTEMSKQHLPMFSSLYSGLSVWSGSKSVKTSSGTSNVSGRREDLIDFSERHWEALRRRIDNIRLLAGEAPQYDVPFFMSRRAALSSKLDKLRNQAEDTTTKEFWSYVKARRQSIENELEHIYQYAKERSVTSSLMKSSSFDSSLTGSSELSGKEQRKSRRKKDKVEKREAGMIESDDIDSQMTSVEEDRILHLNKLEYKAKVGTESARLQAEAMGKAIEAVKKKDFASEEMLLVLKNLNAEASQLMFGEVQGELGDKRKKVVLVGTRRKKSKSNLPAVESRSGSENSSWDDWMTEGSEGGAWRYKKSARNVDNERLGYNARGFDFLPLEIEGISLESLMAQNVQCTWKIGRYWALVCKHPILGRITSKPHQLFWLIDRPEYWESNEYSHVVFYDSELYIHSDPHEDDEEYADRLMEWPENI